jgi:hypothetical protein
LSVIHISKILTSYHIKKTSNRIGHFWNVSRFKEVNYFVKYEC